jgi:hypothetical protein
MNYPANWWPLKEAQIHSVLMEDDQRAIILSRRPDRAWEDMSKPTGGSTITRRFRLFDSFPVRLEGWAHRRYFEWDTPQGVLAFAIDIQDRPEERYA